LPIGSLLFLISGSGSSPKRFEDPVLLGLFLELAIVLLAQMDPLQSLCILQTGALRALATDGTLSRFGAIQDLAIPHLSCRTPSFCHVPAIFSIIKKLSKGRAVGGRYSIAPSGKEADNF
jgi:hypothetical protein